MKNLTWEELQLPDDPSTLGIVLMWLSRGDGIACYENQDMGHPGLGDRKFCSYGSSAAQLETDTPPERLPDIGGEINWRYTLIGVHRPDPKEYRQNQRMAERNVRRCRWLIMVASHYRDDGTCRCDDPEHTEMQEWGYTWDSELKRWS